MLWWTFRAIRSAYKRFRREDDFRARLFPAIAAGLVAIVVGDMFVDYVKLEVRFWLFAVLLVLLERRQDRNPDVDRSESSNALSAVARDVR